MIPVEFILIGGLIFIGILVAAVFLVDRKGQRAYREHEHNMTTIAEEQDEPTNAHPGD